LSAERFEEMIAFATSENPLRRWLSPLFSRGWEAALLVCLLTLSTFGQILFLWDLDPLWMHMITALPWVFIALMLLRLFHNHRLMKRALNKLSLLLKNPEEKYAVLLRLTDEEIIFFAKKNIQQCRDYIEKESSLRWKMLRFAYY